MDVADQTDCMRADQSAGKCRSGLCAPATCGNGTVDPGEECDGASGCLADCTWGCLMDAECDDGDPCNGAETCSNHQCAAGTTLACDDGEPCTADVCTARVGCQHSFIDADRDTYAPALCAAPQIKGGDCDDNDINTYPGAPELCDGKDNDCNGKVDDNISSFPCYPDADGDGYPLNSNPTSPQCKCDAGTVPARNDGKWDCYDNDNSTGTVGTRGIDYNPGITQFFTNGRSVCSGKLLLCFQDYDHNCDSNDEQEWTATSVSSCNDACGDGWVGSSAPGCGGSADFYNCSPSIKLCGIGNLLQTCCTASTITQTQACR
jgi:hypothetical protein